MDRQTFTQAVNELLNGVPFRPFTIVSRHGRRHRVKTSDGVAFRDGIGAGYDDDGVPFCFDAPEVSEIVVESATQGMNRDTFTQTLRALLHRQPFAPFTIVSVHGHGHTITTPDVLAYRDGAAVTLTADCTTIFFHHNEVSKIVDALPERADGAA